MRVLAHYTVIGKNVLNLHVSDISRVQGIRHFPVEVETAHTLFLSGVLAVCSAEATEWDTEELSRLIAGGATMTAASVAALIAGYLEAKGLSFEEGSPFALLKAEYPYRQVAFMQFPD